MSEPLIQIDDDFKAMARSVLQEESRILREKKQQAEMRGETTNSLLGVTMFSHFGKFKQALVELTGLTSEFAREVNMLFSASSEKDIDDVHCKAKSLCAKFAAAKRFVSDVRDLEKSRYERLMELNARVSPIRVNDVKDECVKAMEILDLAHDLDRQYQKFHEASQNLAKLEAVCN